jgi:cation diffusion facilitator family transporter
MTGSGRQPQSWGRALLRGWASALRQLAGRTDDMDGSIRTVSVAFLGNLVVALAKYLGFILSMSSAMLAESVHSTAVTVNQALLLRGRLRSERAATVEHPFGFGRERYFWAFVVAIVMFGIGAVVSVGRGVLQLLGHSEEALEPIIPLAALTVGLVMDGWSFLVARRQTRQDKGELTYRQYVERSKDPEVPVVLLEDAAAMVGLLFAYLGVGLTALTGNQVYDSVASILIGALLALVAFVLAGKMKSLLIGESALPEQRREIETAIAEHPLTGEVSYVRSLYLGPDDLLVEAKVGFRHGLGFEEVAAAIDEIEHEIRSRVSAVRIVAIEPETPVSRDIEVPEYERAEGGE